MKLYGVQFDDYKNVYHTLDTWGLYIVNRQENEPPKPKTYTIDIPGGNGSIDLTDALLGKPVYSNRKITCELYLIESRVMEWAALYSDIMAKIHGKRLRIEFDDDPAYYYIGRVSVTGWKSGRMHSRVTIECDCEPFKYQKNSFGEDWLWDPFDFVDGVITSNVFTIKGTTKITLEVSQMPVTPTFRAMNVTKAMTMTWDGTSYKLPTNTDVKFYDIVLPQGENEISVTGTGELKIVYTNGVL